MGFKVKFWGVRGSIATPSPRHIAFGGNTSCVEVKLGGRTLILDAGTGIRNLGHWMLKRGEENADLLLSHTHWDHINGFPFFSPAFRKSCHFTIRAGHVADRGGIEQVFRSQMAEPFFPVPLEKMGAQFVFQDFRAGDRFTLGDGITVRTKPLNHPDGATGYRIEYGGKAMCYVTDTEHTPGKPDQNVLDLIADADLVIYDSTYTDREYESHVGWGHSTWQEGVRLCLAAGVKQLAIFHHDPDHEDPFMERLEADARQMWTGAIVARENMRINLL
ncbi:MBL fold metallo-hydrolase [Ferrovibrio sp.]|uniref:MBL fold metallo-hydrolase n=1 Tax=Ferrovibrio sp. TaxID=1917215 RepID=UPI001B55D02A|nr:MBL fold metallo-hydrolase [Ferrovibrio sp.]MBP7066234.1 MBL fold metallo-hydrolase [Ferrovibrio sp.]